MGAACECADSQPSLPARRKSVFGQHGLLKLVCMGHRAYIGYLTGGKDREAGVVASYCHWAHHSYGTPEVLLECYNTPETAEAMVGLGARVGLSENPEEFVGLGRGDESLPSLEFSLEEFRGITGGSGRYPDDPHSDIEYTYLFAEGWLIAAKRRMSFLKPGEVLPDSSFGEPLDQVVVAMSSEMHVEAWEDACDEAWS